MMNQLPKSKAIERLQKVLDVIPKLKQMERNSPEFKTWQRNTKVAITKTFGNESENITDFNNISFSAFSSSDSVLQKAYVDGLESAESVLKSMIEEINEYWDDEDQTPTSSKIRENTQITTNEIFIVHGRDEGAKNIVARFLEKLDLKPVILAEMPAKGRTIIEKFEQHGQVGYAIILLTPDDAGSLQGDESDPKPRARQNVIFELGFFIGHLGRKHVCALTKGDVEIPSDYAGIEYIPFNDADGWKLKLIRELKSGGFDIDANRAFV
ncbi:MAG: nucleotide-binding protein [Gemmatimonadota bacterium]|nr:nucleotide-binding protein [Gemmatimonadota bacterium]